MQRISRLLLLASGFLITVCSSAAQPEISEKGAALNAATAWVAILDAKNFTDAAAGFADEFFALMRWPTHDQRVQAGAAILAQPRLVNGRDYVVTRKLRPEGIKRVTSCNCGIGDGDFVVITYDVTYTWTLHALGGVKYPKQGTEVLYMLREKDGTWKPAGIAMQLS